MTLGELKKHIDELLESGYGEDVPLKIAVSDSPRFEDMELEFSQIFVDDKDKLSGAGNEALTCFWIKG
jgi:hypothetical protein